MNIIRRWKVFLSVAVPIGHPLTVYLTNHLEVMRSFEQPWKNYLTHKPLKYRLKSVLHLKFFMLRFERFIVAINQGRPIPALDPNEIPDAVLNGIRWEPLLTPAFSARYHLDHFAQLHPPGGPPPAVPAPASRIPQPITPAGVGGAIPTPAGSGGAIPIINPVISPRENRMVNTSFNVNLFGIYRISGIKARALRDKIEQGSLLSRECRFVLCLPEPSFADMVCRVGNMLATCLWSCRRLGDIACRQGCPKRNDMSAFADICQHVVACRHVV